MGLLRQDGGGLDTPFDEDDIVAAQRASFQAQGFTPEQTEQAMRDAGFFQSSQLGQPGLGLVPEEFGGMGVEGGIVDATISTAAKGITPKTPTPTPSSGGVKAPLGKTAAKWFLKIPGIQAAIDTWFTHDSIKEIMANPNLTASQKKRLVGETVFTNLGGFLGGASGAATIAAIGTTMGIVPGAGWAAAIASYILAIGAWIGGEWAGNKMAGFLGDQFMGDDGKEALGASIISGFGYDPDGALLDMLPDSQPELNLGTNTPPGLGSGGSGTTSMLGGSEKVGFTSRAGGYQGQLLMAKMSRQGLLGPEYMNLPINHEFRVAPGTNVNNSGNTTNVNVNTTGGGGGGVQLLPQTGSQGRPVRNSSAGGGYNSGGGLHP